MADRIVLTIGTKKGVFVAEAAKPRRSFTLRGPFGAGVPVYSTLIDTRGTPRIYASSCNPFFGMKVLRSTDVGKSFTETKSAPAFPKDDGRALVNIWSLEPGGGKKDLWCGVEPASLFRSHDGGDSWEMVPGISNHEHARKMATRQWRALHAHDHSRQREIACTWASQRAVIILVRTVAKHLGRPIKASALDSPPTPIPSSVNAFTKSRGMRTRPGGSTCKTTADGQIGRDLAGPGRTLAYYAATITATLGGRSLRDCRRISDFLSWSIRTTPTRYTSCRLGGDADLSRRRASGVAQREWRRVVEPARKWVAEEAELLHRAARRDGHRSAQGVCTLLRHDDWSAVDRERGW